MQCAQQIISHICYFEKLGFKSYPKFYIFTFFKHYSDLFKLLSRIRGSSEYPEDRWGLAMGKVGLVRSQNLSQCPGGMAKSMSAKIFDGSLNSALNWWNRVVILCPHPCFCTSPNYCTNGSLFSKEVWDQSSRSQKQGFYSIVFQPLLAELNFPGQKFSHNSLK